MLDWTGLEGTEYNNKVVEKSAKITTETLCPRVVTMLCGGESTVHCNFLFCKMYFWNIFQELFLLKIILFNLNINLSWQDNF